jgi:hypothetical protein
LSVLFVFLNHFLKVSSLAPDARNEHPLELLSMNKQSIIGLSWLFAEPEEGHSEKEFQNEGQVQK